MSSSFDREELLRLIDANCAGMISDEEHKRLEGILAESKSARQLYFEYIDLDLCLNRITQGAPMESACPAIPGDLLDDLPMVPRNSRSYWSYGVVAAATFALSLVLQVFLYPGRRTEALVPSPRATELATAPGYIATLGATADCRWKNVDVAWSEGWRLLPGEMHLARGLAEIRFDSGATVVIEGPTRIQIESADSATLLEGQAVLHGDDVSDGFQLHIPDATLVDIGTEYAVSVGADGASEIHVFDGVVLRHPKGAEAKTPSEELSAGDARRFQAELATNVPLDADRFVRRVPARQKDRDVQDDLLVVDRFEYAVDSLPTEGDGAAGIGWAKPWRGSRDKPGLDIRPLEDTDDIDRHVVGNGALWGDGIGEVGRHAEVPLRMDVDAVYYVSFVFQRFGDPTRKFLQFRLHQSTNYDIPRMVRMGIAHPGLAFLDLGSESVRTRLPLETDKPYLFVAKIVAGRARPDQAFMTVYRLGQEVEHEEPISWTLSTPPVDCDGQLDAFWFLFRGEGTQAVDELRIGRTWQSVTEPFRNAPEAKG